MKNYKFKLASISVLASVIILSGCVSAPSRNPEMPESTPSYQRLNYQQNTQQGAIFQAQSAMGLFEDIKARQVGDILTIFLVEQTSGQNSADSSISQSTEMNVIAPTFGGRNRPNMAIDLGSENAFNGGSGSSQSNSLNGSVTVTVHQILPNGNLIVEGEKWVNINQANEYVRLSGVVRPVDISTSNSLFSTQVADARISYGGGANKSNTPGWAARVIFSPLWPF